MVLGSDPISAVGSAITVILVALWLMCTFLHLRALWRYELLAPGRDQGVDDVNDPSWKKPEADEEESAGLEGEKVD